MNLRYSMFQRRDVRNPLPGQGVVVRVIDVQEQHTHLRKKFPMSISRKSVLYVYVFSWCQLIPVRAYESLFKNKSTTVAKVYRSNAARVGTMWIQGCTI